MTIHPARLRRSARARRDLGAISARSPHREDRAFRYRIPQWDWTLCRQTAILPRQGRTGAESL